jgi:hypothetical protein
MENPIRILVLDRGFVFVCRCPDPRDAGFWLDVTDCRTVRAWGTEHGLGQLYGGPTNKTVLDALVPRKCVPVRAVLDTFEVDQSAWAPHLLAAAGSTTVKAGSSGRTGSRKSGAKT